MHFCIQELMVIVALWDNFPVATWYIQEAFDRTVANSNNV